MSFLFGLMGRGFSRMGSGGSGKSHGGPFLLLADGTSKLRLFNNTSRLLITGVAPASGFVPTFYILGF